MGHQNVKHWPDYFQIVLIRATPGKVLCGGSQFGSGLNGGETAFAHLYVRLFSMIVSIISFLVLTCLWIL